MFTTQFKLPVLRPIRFLIATVVCTLLLFTSVLPSSAIAASTSSRPSEGTANLDKTLKESERAARSAPPSMKEVQAKASEGPNEVQGGADKDKMKNNANSEGTTVEERVKDALRNITGS